MVEESGIGADTARPGERLGGGRMAEVYAFGDRRVIKLARPEWAAMSPDAEVAAQRAVSEADVPAPAVFGTRTVDGRPGIVMERIQGLDGLTGIDRKPWRVSAVGRMTGVLHRDLSRVPAPAELPSLKAAVFERLTASPRIPRDARTRLLLVLEPLPDGDRVCHMDFHPGNVIESPTGPVIIDFANAMAGDPMADHAKTAVLLKAGEPPPDSTRWARALIAVGRGLAARAYLAGYGPLTDEERTRAVLWRPVILALRLDEGIAEERRRMLRMLARALKAAEAVSR